MNRKELEKRLREEGIRPDVYSLYGSDFDERLVLSQISGGKYQIYYFERGLKSNLKEYPNESEACEAFLKALRSDPLAKIKA